MDTREYGKKMCRTFFILIALVCFEISAHAQRCWVPMQKNLRPDTITVYSFYGKHLPVKQFPDSKPISNYGFKTKYFNLLWITTKNVEPDLEKGVIYLGRNYVVIDTIRIKIFDQPFIGYVIKQKNRIGFILYPSQKGKQDVFVASVKRKKRLNECIDYMRKNFSTQ